MKKVGILTFHNYNNYGAILQSYALHKYLKKLGSNPEIIDYNCSYISNPFSLKRLHNKGLFEYIYGILGYLFYLPRRGRCNHFRKNMTYSRPVTRRNVKTLDGSYDVTIAGSDQIWNPALTNFDKSYFLDFVTKGKKCSYAASTGEQLPSQKDRDEYRQLLSSFDRILLRESYGADLVEELTGTRPECSCDPTFLLTKAEWEELLPKTSTKKPYILAYQLGVNPGFVKFVKRLKQQTGLPVSYIPFPLVGLLPCRTNLWAGPIEWLCRFRDAEYIITDSFHGVVFALLFQKRFFVLADGHHKNRRVRELLEHLGLTNRIITSDLSDRLLTENIDYTGPEQIIQTMREDSIEKLKQMIS